MAAASNELVPFASYAVAQFDTATLSEALEANLAGGDVNLDRDLDRVKIPGSGGTTWTIPTLEGEEETKVLEGIIVAWKNVRAYYATSFDENPGMPPTCSSNDAVVGHGFPFHKGDGEPEGDPTTLPCANCPNSQWGTAEKGNGQACQQNRLLFMLTPGDMLPLIVKLPATSIKPCGNFFMGLTRKGKPFYAVQTRIALEKTKNDANIDYSEARFSLAHELNPDEIAVVKQYRAALQPLVEQTRGVDPVPAPDAS